MKRISTILVVGIVLVSFVLTPSIFAGKSWHVRSPRGGLVQLLVTDSALKNVRIYDLAFSENGDSFSITAASRGTSDSSISFTISFYDDEVSVQDDYVDVSPDKTTQEIYCPETFNKIVLDYSEF